MYFHGVLPSRPSIMSFPSRLATMSFHNVVPSCPAAMSFHHVVSIMPFHHVVPIMSTHHVLPQSRSTVPSHHVFPSCTATLFSHPVVAIIPSPHVVPSCRSHHVVPSRLFHFVGTSCRFHVHHVYHIMFVIPSCRSNMTFTSFCWGIPEHVFHLVVSIMLFHHVFPSCSVEVFRR